ncbi:ABC transporter permease, partial [Mycoplasmopsis pullorum]
NNFAYYLNLKYDNNLSGKISNSEYFYLNNQKDNLYLVPNGYAKNEFSDKQKEFITQAYNKSKNSVNELAWYSYLVVPYQFLDIFNNNKTQHNKNNLDNYLNYNNSDSYLYNYKLDQNAKLFNYEKDQQKYYLIPSLLKNQTERENIVNTTLIYAREGADSFNLNFPEDTYVFSASDNLVGELKWKFLINVLKDQNFNDYAKKLFVQVEAKIKNDEPAYAKTKILEKIEKELNNSDSFLNRYQNSFVALFDEKMIENKTIKTLTEKKIYLAAALIYYVYFNLQDSKILESILWNNDNSTFEPHQLKVQIGDYKYNIGGYSAYTTMQEVREIDGEKNVVIRYNLDSNENYMFQNVTNVFELSRSNPIIIKETYFIIWILLISLLLTINGIKYTKKDYK